MAWFSSEPYLFFLSFLVILRVGQSLETHHQSLWAFQYNCLYFIHCHFPSLSFPFFQVSRGNNTLRGFSYSSAGFEFRLCHVFVMWPQISHLIIWSLNSFFCNMEIISRIYLIGMLWGLNKIMHIRHSAQCPIQNIQSVFIIAVVIVAIKISLSLFGYLHSQFCS